MMRWLRLLLEGLCAGLVAGLILVTCVDVAGRYLFNKPLAGAYELTQILLGALIFAALPLTTGKGGHVEVDLLMHLMPAPARRVLGVIGAALTSLVLAFFAWRLIWLVGDLRVTRLSTPGLFIPLWYLAAIGVVSCIISAIVALQRRAE